MEGLVEGLKHNSTITTLILKENTISDSGCEVLQKFMSANKNITYLVCSHIHSTDVCRTFLTIILDKKAPLIWLQCF